MILVLNIQVLFCVHLFGLLNSANKMSILAPFLSYHFLQSYAMSHV